MTQEVTNLLLAKSKTRSKIDLLEAERQIVLMQHQEICTDPSPNVARSQSIMDWRKKTWRNPNEIQAEKFITQTHQVKPNELSDKIVLHPLKETIHIPDAILRTFSSIS